jgi:chemotaxis response regulator CheB
MTARKPGDPYRVLVVDDSFIFAEGLRALIQMDPELQVVGVARDGLEALEMVHALQPDVMTMDLRMPRLGGLEAIERVMAERPTPILVLSAAEELAGESLGRELRKRGAVGHRPKPARHRSAPKTLAWADGGAWRPGGILHNAPSRTWLAAQSGLSPEPDGLGSECCW